MMVALMVAVAVGVTAWVLAPLYASVRDAGDPPASRPVSPPGPGGEA